MIFASFYIYFHTRNSFPGDFSDFIIYFIYFNVTKDDGLYFIEAKGSNCKLKGLRFNLS